MTHTLPPPQPGRRDRSLFASPLLVLAAAAIGLLAALLMALAIPGRADATSPQVNVTGSCAGTLTLTVHSPFTEPANVEVYQATTAGAFLGRPPGATFTLPAGGTTSPMVLTWPGSGAYVVGVNFRFPSGRASSDTAVTVNVSAQACGITSSSTPSSSAAPTTTVAPTTTTAAATTTTAAATTTTVLLDTCTPADTAPVCHPGSSTTPPTTADDTPQQQALESSTTTTPARLPSTGAGGASTVAILGGGLIAAGALVLAARRRIAMD